MSRPTDMTLVGIDGELELYASSDKKMGVLYNTANDELSDPKPLQTFFKWGNFVAVDESATAAVRAKGMAHINVGSL